jgi:hypothetical protein
MYVITGGLGSGSANQLITQGYIPGNHVYMVTPGGGMAHGGQALPAGAATFWIFASPIFGSRIIIHPGISI